VSLPSYPVCEFLNPGEIAGLVKDQIIQMNESEFERVALHGFTFFACSLDEKSFQLEL
jgi:hypothetical protein